MRFHDVAIMFLTCLLLSLMPQILLSLAAILAHEGVKVPDAPKVAGISFRERIRVAFVWVAALLLDAVEFVGKHWRRAVFLIVAVPSYAAIIGPVHFLAFAFLWLGETLDSLYRRWDAWLMLSRLGTVFSAFNAWANK